jgi:signal transduction histidine kinase
MNEAAARLSSRVVRRVAVASLVATTLMVAIIPDLLLLEPSVAIAAADRELLLLSGAGLAAVGLVAARLGRHRYLLRALALGSRSVEPSEMEDLGREPGRLSRRWLIPHLMAFSALVTPVRPDEVDLPTGTSLATLGAIIAAAISLFLYVLVRALFLRAAELAPADVMRELIETAERNGNARWRIQRRLRTAVLTPVALVAVGAALIASAHVRRAEEVAREGTARAVARAALDLAPGVVSEAGRDDATALAASLGFAATYSDTTRPYRAERGERGLTVLTVPLDTGSTQVSFHGSNVPVMSTSAFVLALLTIALAAGLGGALGRSHTLDLQHATEGVRLLGTEAVIRGGRLPVRPPVFRDVAALEQSIEHLAARFGVFAQAQERAILAREAATRMRGLFFASVSHDLKSPLNAILGFAELVRAETLTNGQLESLDVIDRRGRELLALIETILDAARVEAKQLALVVERTNPSELAAEAIAKARDLEGDPSAETVVEIGADVPELVVDRVRMARALSTMVAFAMRQGRASPVRLRAFTDGAGGALIEIAIPGVSGRSGERELSRLLNSAGRPGAGEHRGLALGLSLARSIVELHGGVLGAVVTTAGSPAFSVRLPAPVS